MPIRSSRFANEEDLGRGFSNLAAMFAPPDSGDLANYADAGLKNQRKSIIEKLQSDPRYQGFDQQSILADLYDPTQSFYKVNIDDATTRRGQDITAATSTANNAADNTRAFVTSMYGPLNQGEIRPDVPAGISSMFGVDQALPQVAGAPKPLSETEVRGGILSNEIPNLSPEQLTGIAMGNTPVQNVVGPDGKPVIELQSDAVGMEPYFNKGAEAKPENAVARLRDGTIVPAVQGPDGKWHHAQTDALLPDDIQVFDMPKAVGTAADVGLSKTTDSYVEKQLIDIGIAKDTAVKLRDLIATSPASQGLVGWLRGTTQNIIETGGELGGFFGGKVKEVTDDISKGLADADLAGSFDPKIPAIEMMANLLAFQYAKTTTGERLSNEMLRNAKEALGLNGLDANQKSSIARINQAILMIQSQQDMLNSVLKNGISATNTPAPPTPDITKMGDATAVPPGWDPEDWKYLDDSEKQQVLSGK